MKTSIAIGFCTPAIVCLMQVAHDEKIEKLFATILAQNVEMQKLAENLGFKLKRSMTDSEVSASIDLRSPTTLATLG